MQLVVLDAAAGGLLLAAIAFAARRQRFGARSHALRVFGWILIAGPLPLAVILHLFAPLPPGADQAAFLTGVAAFAIGAALVLGREEEDWGEPAEDESPPWWPAFERELRDYERLTRRPKVLR
jgi:hypothetical protein